MKQLWIKIKDAAIKFGVRGLIKAGKAAEAKKLCLEIIKEIDEQVK